MRTKAKGRHGVVCVLNCVIHVWAPWGRDACHLRCYINPRTFTFTFLLVAASKAYSIGDWCVCVDECRQNFCKSHVATTTVFLSFSHDLCANAHKTLEQLFKIFGKVFLSFKFWPSLWNSLNWIPAVTFDRRFFTRGELMPLDGFTKQWSYLGRPASSHSYDQF